MAASDAACQHGVVAHALRASDLDAALALSQEAGWNQTRRRLADFSRTRQRDLPDAWRRCRRSRPRRRLPYARRLCLDQHGARHGCGAAAGSRAMAVARVCREFACRRALVPVLDATPAGRAVYVGLGFRGLLEHAPAGRPRDSNRGYGWAYGSGGSPAGSARLAGRLSLTIDAVFGADRSALLRPLADACRQAALVAEREDGSLVSARPRRPRDAPARPSPAADDASRSPCSHAPSPCAPGPLASTCPTVTRHLRGWLAERWIRRRAAHDRMVYRSSLCFDDSRASVCHRRARNSAESDPRR